MSAIRFSDVTVGVYFIKISSAFSTAKIFKKTAFNLAKIYEIRNNSLIEANGLSPMHFKPETMIIILGYSH